MPRAPRAPRAAETVSIREAADILGLSDRTIRNYIAQGRLSASRVGPRLIRVQLADVEAMLEPVNTYSTAS